MATQAKETVLITGICGSLGKLVAQKLSSRFHVLGVDSREYPNPPANVEMVRLDLRRKSAFSLLLKKKPQCIIHLGIIRNPLKTSKDANAYHFNLETTTQLLKVAEKIKVRKFVFLSTANLYGPSSRTTGFLSEDAPLHGANRSPEVRDLVALDIMIQSFFWKQPNIETVILRPVHIVGAHLRNAPSLYSRQKYMPTIMGYDPMIQVIHESDVVAALALTLKSGVRGIFNLTNGEQAPLTRMIEALGKKPLPIPEPVFRLGLEFAFRHRLSTFPPGELDHLKYSCLVDGSFAQKGLGFKAQKNLLQSLHAMI